MLKPETQPPPETLNLEALSPQFNIPVSTLPNSWDPVAGVA